MQRYRLVQHFDYFIDTVVDILMESKTPLYDMVDLPNVSNSKLIEEKDLGDTKLIKNEWCVHGQIPPMAQKFIKPEMLTFVEDSVWDRRTKVYSTKVIPHFLKNQVDVRHKVEHIDNGDGRTKRIVSGYIEVKIPVIGPIFEATVIKYIKQNAEEDFKMTSGALDKYIQGNGDPNGAKSYKKS